MICIVLLAAIVPITSLAVDGSVRTFNRVEVIPSSSEIVGRGVGDKGVVGGSRVVVVGSVSVISAGGAVSVLLFCTEILQLVKDKQIITRVAFIIFMNTG